MPARHTPPAIPPELPLLALRSTIVFPHGRIAVQVGTAENRALLASLDTAALVLVAVAPGPATDDLARLAGRIGVVEIGRAHV